MELHNQGKQITLFKVLVHMGIKAKEEADRAAKQAIDMSGMITTRLPHTDHQEGYKLQVANIIGKKY